MCLLFASFATSLAVWNSLGAIRFFSGVRTVARFQFELKEDEALAAAETCGGGFYLREAKCYERCEEQEDVVGLDDCMASWSEGDEPSQEEDGPGDCGNLMASWLANSSIFYAHIVPAIFSLTLGALNMFVLSHGTKQHVWVGRIYGLCVVIGGASGGLTGQAFSLVGVHRSGGPVDLHLFVGGPRHLPLAPGRQFRGGTRGLYPTASRVDGLVLLTVICGRDSPPVAAVPDTTPPCW